MPEKVIKNRQLDRADGGREVSNRTWIVREHEQDAHLQSKSRRAHRIKFDPAKHWWAAKAQALANAPFDKACAYF